MKNNLFFTIGLPLLLAACIMIGCTSTGGSKEPVEPGTLTITGIPEEYNGKFASARIQSIPDYTAKKSSYFRVATGVGTAIIDGKIKMPVNIFKIMGKPAGYNGSDTLDVIFMICDTLEETKNEVSFDVIFASVPFKNGIAEVSWDDAIKPGIITVINIPAEYEPKINSARTQILIGQTSYILTVNPETPYGSGYTKNGTVTVAVLRGRDASGYESYTENAKRDILLSIMSPDLQKEAKLVQTAPDHQFLFKAVEIIDGKATIDFRQGTRQR